MGKDFIEEVYVSQHIANIVVERLLENEALGLGEVWVKPDDESIRFLVHVEISHEQDDVDIMFDRGYVQAYLTAWSEAEKEHALGATGAWR